MANPRIDVEIGSKVEGLQSGIKQAESQIQKLGNSTKQASPKVDNLTKSLSGANGVSIEFSRIIQDAPFGIIGVGNNITQLAGSFSNLQRQTGSTTKALKVAFQSIISPANLLVLGISAITTVLTLYQTGAFKSKKETESLREELEKYRGTLDGIQRASIDGQSSAQKELANLRALQIQAENTNLTQKQRISAVDELQSKYPNYLGNLSKEEILAGKAGDSYAQLTKSIIATGKAQAFRNEIGKNSIDLLTLETQEQERVSKILDARAKLESISISKQLATGQDLLALKNQEAIQQGRINDLINEQTESANKRVKISEQNVSLESKIVAELQKGGSFAKILADETERFKNNLQSSGIFIDEYSNRLLALTTALQQQRTALEIASAGLTGNEGQNLDDPFGIEGLLGDEPPIKDIPDELVDSIKEKTTAISDAFSSLGVQIGNSLNISNNALRGFVTTILSSTPKIIQAIFKQAAAKKASSEIENQANIKVATGNAIVTATEGAKGLGPVGLAILPVLIGGAVALISSAFKKGGGGGSSGGVGSGVSGTSFNGQGVTGFASNREIFGELVVRGNDLVYVFDESRNKIAKG